MKHKFSWKHTIFYKEVEFGDHIVLRVSLFKHRQYILSQGENGGKPRLERDANHRISRQVKRKNTLTNQVYRKILPQDNKISVL